MIEKKKHVKFFTFFTLGDIMLVNEIWQKSDHETMKIAPAIKVIIRLTKFWQNQF